MQHCDYQLFLLSDKGRIVGRIAAFFNRVANQHWKDRIGFFGHYECIEDLNTSARLLQTALNWLKEKNMRIMRGPWNFISQDFGLTVEGYDLPATILSSFNPAFYNDHLLNFGFSKAMDMLVYNCDLSKGYVIPDRFLDFSDRIAKRYHVTVRPLNMKNIVEEAKIIVRLTNDSLTDNWGFYPIAEEEAEDLAADLRSIIHPQAVLIAEINQEPIGYLLALPDVNHLIKNLKGRLLPLGFFKLLFGIQKLNRYRIWAMGIVPKFQKKGISILLFHKLNEVLAPRRVYVEANWVLENNALMNNALKQLKFDLVKRYRVYDKTI